MWAGLVNLTGHVLSGLAFNWGSHGAEPSPHEAPVHPHDPPSIIMAVPQQAPSPRDAEVWSSAGPDA
jgi:hypothetical protein